MSIQAHAIKEFIDRAVVRDSEMLPPAQPAAPPSPVSDVGGAVESKRRKRAIPRTPTSEGSSSRQTSNPYSPRPQNTGEQLKISVEEMNDYQTLLEGRQNLHKHVLTLTQMLLGDDALSQSPAKRRRLREKSSGRSVTVGRTYTRRHNWPTRSYVHGPAAQNRRGVLGKEYAQQGAEASQAPVERGVEHHCAPT